MPFEIIRNDLACVKADAIVNTANPLPVIGAGTDSAIHAKAGPRLLEERKKIGRIEPGCSVQTPAFGLDARYVLHTVSPVWVDGRHQEKELLRKAYDAALGLAAELGCGSVAFPLMAAGSYRFPRELALRVAIDAFTDFLLQHEMDVYLVVFDNRAFHLACGLFSDLKSFIDENYVAEQTAKERPYEAEATCLLWEREAEDRRRPRDQEQLQLNRRERETAWKAAKAPKAQPMEDVPMMQPIPLEVLLENNEPTFSQLVLQKLAKRDGKDSEVYLRGGMSRQLFNKIINTVNYVPKKSTVLQLAIGLQLDLAQTQELLASAGYVLTHSDKRDVVVEYFIRNREYSISAIDIVLYDHGLATLSARDKDA